MIEKIKNLAATKRKHLGLTLYKENNKLKSVAEKDVKFGVRSSKNLQTRAASLTMPKIIGVGSSTGGPQALLKFLTSIKDNLTLPIVITQHMPPSFTKILAGHLSKATGLDCIEAEDRTLIEAGKVYVAPGDHHMVIKKRDDGKYHLRLNQDPPENFCRPAVDPMFRSLSNEFWVFFFRRLF